MKLVQAIETEDIRVAVTDLVGDIVELMDSQGYNALPVVKEELFLGLVHADQIREIENPDTPLEELGLPLRQLFLHQEQHLFDALPYFAARSANVLAVVNSKQGYVGLVTPLGLLSGINSLMDSERPGSILVLELGQRDNALSHIAHIVETADAQVLSSMTRLVPDSSRLEMTLKVSATNLSGVVAALLRYDYRVLTTFSQEVDDRGINARYEHLMNYINM